MEKKVTKKALAGKKKAASAIIELKGAEVAVASSPVKKRSARVVKPTAAAAKKVRGSAAKAPVVSTPAATVSAATSEPQRSAAFNVLAEPKLPEIKRENRARLLMQTPTRLYFYWSVRENPWQLLRDAFGSDTGSYALVLKLTNLRRDSEQIHPVEAEGNWWFDVEPDGEYQAEIGFYAPNRPYFRIVYSNVLETPRRAPSPRAATEAHWTVSANKFAEVLDVAGFSSDAFDVVLAGDDQNVSGDVTNIAFNRFMDSSGIELEGIAAGDIRYAMISIASGAALEDLRWKISPALFAILQANAEKVRAASAMSALTEYFDIDEAEFSEEQLGAAVYGASLVNFPRTLKTRTLSERYAPVSSHSNR